LSWFTSLLLQTYFVQPFGLVEKIGIQNIFDNLNQKYFVAAFGSPNRRLLNKKVIWEWRRPFDIVAEYREKIAQGCFAGLSPSSAETAQSIVWSNILNDARTYFEQVLL